MLLGSKRNMMRCHVYIRLLCCDFVTWIVMGYDYPMSGTFQMDLTIAMEIPCEIHRLEIPES